MDYQITPLEKIPAVRENYRLEATEKDLQTLADSIDKEKLEKLIGPMGDIKVFTAIQAAVGRGLETMPNWSVAVFFYRYGEDKSRELGLTLRKNPYEKMFGDIMITGVKPERVNDLLTDLIRREGL